MVRFHKIALTPTLSRKRERGTIGDGEIFASPAGGRGRRAQRVG